MARSTEGRGYEGTRVRGAVTVRTSEACRRWRGGAGWGGDVRVNRVKGVSVRHGDTGIWASGIYARACSTCTMRALARKPAQASAAPARPPPRIGEIWETPSVPAAHEHVASLILPSVPRAPRARHLVSWETRQRAVRCAIAPRARPCAERESRTCASPVISGHPVGLAMPSAASGWPCTPFWRYRPSGVGRLRLGRPESRGPRRSLQAGGLTVRCIKGVTWAQGAVRCAWVVHTDGKCGARAARRAVLCGGVEGYAQLAQPGTAACLGKL